MNRNPIIERIQQVKNQYQSELLRLPNVVGLGIGYKETAGQFTDQLALIINVSRKLPLAQLAPDEIAPPQIEDVPTDVQETGPFKAL